MGDPKTPRRVWKKPKRPLNYDLMMDELKTLGTFGLKTKKELWKTQTELSRVRLQARSLLALRQEERERKEPILIQSLSKIGLVDQNSTLDDVLNLQVNDLLSRRLQTMAQRKLFFKTPYQARQAIVHGHVMIGDSVVTIPSYIVKTEEETKIRLIPESRFNETLSKPESDLGSPETENLEIETGDQPKNEEPPVKQDAEKESTEESPVKQDAEKESTEES
uniref:Small ribosomal subunit protein uS4 n=1 Tax=uncultured marine thaumarchaeote KM3_201_G04 TaxID=1456094 RepID=A0A075GU54_9ARCH|nr:ribosomal protein S4P (RP-S4, rpsD) [uncultured marine thaumarchaeote KM3_201_G04]